MKILIKIILILSFTFFFKNLTYSANEDNIYQKIDLFSEVLDKINKEYVEEINQSDAMDSAIDVNCRIHSIALIYFFHIFFIDFV